MKQKYIHKTQFFWMWSLPLLLFVAVSACQPKPEPTSVLREGDLLFQDLNCGPLCDAIEAVTEGIDGRDFSHCALVISVNDTLRVIEAIGDRVQIHSLQTFFQRSGDTNEVRNTVVARMQPAYRHLLPKALQYANQQVGKPYDDPFLPDNDRFYCSELISEAFRSANAGEEVFPLAPMTFRDPETQAFFPAWISYYEDLDQPIPEGVPGINPGLISRSDKLEIVPVKLFSEVVTD